jgi:IS66 C-terminal element
VDPAYTSSAAVIYTLIETAKLNDVDPRAWLADVLARLPDHPAKRLHELLPWNWRRQATTLAASVSLAHMARMMMLAAASPLTRQG